MTSRLTIVQHNVRSFATKKTTLSNIYNQINPDVILLNEIGKQETNLKIFNYNVHYSNKTNEPFRGAAIAIKKNIQSKLIDNFHSDLIAASIPTRHGNITIATTYIPPRDNYLNFIDFNKLNRIQEPAILIADLNAKHRSCLLYTSDAADE